MGGPRDSHLCGLPPPPNTQPVSSSEAQRTWLGPAEEKQTDAFISKAPIATHGRVNQKCVWSQLGPAVAWPPQGRQEAVISSGQAPQAQDAVWKVTGSRRLHCACLSQTDYLIWLGPTPPEHRVLFTAPVPNQSLIHTV